MELTTLFLLASIAVVVTKPYPGNVELVAEPAGGGAFSKYSDFPSNLELVDEDEVDAGAHHSYSLPPIVSMVRHNLTT